MCALRQIADSNQTVCVCVHVCVDVGHGSNMLLWDSEEAGWHFPAAVVPAVLGRACGGFHLSSRAVFVRALVKSNVCGLGL